MGFNAYDKDPPHLTTYQREMKRIAEGRQKQLSEALRAAGLHEAVGFSTGYNYAIEHAARVIETKTMPDLLLAAGEMSAQERRTARAMQRLFAAEVRGLISKSGANA